MDTNRFTQKSLEALQAAQQLAQSYGNAQVEQVHLLDALLSQENGLIGQLMGKLGLNVQQVRTACESAVNRLPKISGSNQQPYVTASLSQALTEAENQMKQMRDEYISVEHLFLGLLEKADSTVRPLFASLDITKPKFLEALQAVRGSARVTSEDPESTYDALKKYGQDLVELARQNKLDPVIGRDTEIRNAIRILSRKSKNNPVLIGEPGVGKTAIAEGLAQRIVRGDGPDSLIYCDPPYFDAENLYAVDFPKEKHEELHWILSQCKGYIVVSYNDCPFIRSLYGDFYILAFRRNNPLSQKAGATYGELIITNYDPRPYIQPQFSMFPAEIENGDLVLVHEPACGSLREIYLRGRNEHETDKNDAPAGAGGEAGNGCEMSAGSNGPNDGDGDWPAQYPADQPPDERGGGA